MKKLLKGLGIGLLALTLAGGAVYAYVALTITVEVDVQEPISIVTWAGDGVFDSGTGIWDIGQTFPLDTAAITITLANSASGPIVLTVEANPSSLDGGNLTFSFGTPTVEVPAGGTASVTLTATSTQSLAAGNYSTSILIQR